MNEDTKDSANDPNLKDFDQGKVFYDLEHVRRWVALKNALRVFKCAFEPLEPKRK